MKKEKVGEYLQKSLDNLRLKQVDLYLIQNPVGYKELETKELYPRDDKGVIELDKTTNLCEVWQAMVDQVKAGKTKAIGMCNFKIGQLEKVIEKTKVYPDNIQAECHLYFQQQELRKWAQANGVVFTAYACLGSPAMMKVFHNARGNDDKTGRISNLKPRNLTLACGTQQVPFKGLCKETSSRVL
ncbi:hypothetical protein J6590_101344 [Homalodisca vitripennis]|nr:hypothetical protein J6590_101344 [Homalodisca vitripennis]